MFKLSVEKVSFKYLKDEVIKDLSLEFAANAINVIIGLNGSGKTTLIKLVAGILKPSKGIVYLNDKDISNYSFLERSKYIAYVTQEIEIGNDHLVIDYLSFGLMNTLKFYESPSEKSKTKIKKAAEKFHISHFLYKKMNELSGGEKQIISICRAYVQDTKIIILDEPTSALDFKNQHLVLNILKEVASVGKTIILSSHNPNHALYLNSNSILIDKGVIVKTGASKDIVKKEILAQIYGNKIVYSKELDYDEVTTV
jgi:iron complex transport system ATP-binding protein